MTTPTTREREASYCERLSLPSVCGVDRLSWNGAGATLLAVAGVELILWAVWDDPILRPT